MKLGKLVSCRAANEPSQAEFEQGFLSSIGMYMSLNSTRAQEKLKTYD